MNLFLDTEFTTFEAAKQQVISVGLVSECGNHEFYVEINNHTPEFRSDFVNEVVMPLTDMAKYGKSYDWACQDLKDWLASLPANRIQIICDYVGDWHLVSPMLKPSIPGKVVSAAMFNHAFLETLQGRGSHTSDKISAAFKALMTDGTSYYQQDPRQHHALVDAKANRHAWIKGLEAGK